jgi:hypothetical protein
VCLALAALTSCSHPKPLSRDELQSKLRSAASVAAEANTFVTYVRQQRATDQYASGHLEYLLSEFNRTAKELHQALPTSDAGPQFAEGVKHVDALAEELTKLQSRIENRDELAREQDQIAAINKRLQQVISSL